MKYYDIGDTIRLSVSIRVAGASTPVDPTTVKLQLRNPSGVASELTFGVDAAVVRDAAGDYHYDLVPDAAGRWDFRWLGEGSAFVAHGDRFQVQDSPFV